MLQRLTRHTANCNHKINCISG